MWPDVSVGVLVVPVLFLFWALRRFRRKRARLAVAPLRDALTYLPNTALFADRVGQGIQRAKRNKIKFAIVLIEYEAERDDGMVFGSEFSDRMLVEGTNRMKATLRASDTLARVGDRFAAGFDLPDMAAVACVVQRIHASLKPPVVIYGAPDVRASVKITSAVYPDDGADAESLLRLAVSLNARRPPSPTIGMEQEIVTAGARAAGHLSSQDRATG